LSQKVVPRPWCLPVLGLIVVTLMAIAPAGPSAAAESTPTPVPVQSGPEGQVANAPRVSRYARDNDIKFERLSTERGLSSGVVFCILQDSRGLIWFGTQDGLNKYDGYAFTVYRHSPEDIHSLSDDTVWTIYEDQAGVLWIGTDKGGLNRFDRDNGQFVHYRADQDDPASLSHNSVRAIYEDRSGVLWIGTGGGGLDRFDRETEQFTHYRSRPNDPHGLSHDFVTSIYEDRSGVLWVGTNGGGLDRFDRESEQFVSYQVNPIDPNSLGETYEVSTDPYSPGSNYVMTIYEDRAGALWIGTWGGLDRFDRDKEQFVHYQNDANDPDSLSHNYVPSIYEDRSGVLWVGTGGGGLNRLDRVNERFIHYRTDLDDPYSLSNDRVWAVYQDRSGVLWIGTGGGGLAKFDMETEKFAHYQTNPNDPYSLSHNNVTAIYEDRSGMIWIGTGGGGLNQFDRQRERFTHYQSDPDGSFDLSHNTVASIYEDGAGVLWVGTFGGLNRFDRESDRFYSYQNDPDDPHSLSGNSVRPICEDGSGALWVGTNRGLNRFDRETEEFIRYQHDPTDPDSLSHDNVLSIYKDRSGVLWIGTFGGGLDRFDPASDGFLHYQSDPDDLYSLSDNNVASIYEDQSGVLWVGTVGGGLNEFDRDRGLFTHYRYGEDDGLPSDIVYGILEDDHGNLWLSTNEGLARFDPQGETFKRYDVGDGLQSNEFNSGAYYRSRSGEMLFGGVNGFNIFHPDQITDNPYVPPIVLTLLTQDGFPVDTAKALEDVQEVTLHWPNNFFEFEFAALSFVQPEKNQYAYMLEGFDEDWKYLGTRRFGRYTNLPGRNFTLRVKGSNNDGVWNEQGASVGITVVPPFWATWWFRAVVALLVVGGAVGGYRWRVKSIETRTRELEAQVEERTRALEHRTDEIERRRQELEALYRADAELHRHLRLDQVLQALVDIAVDILRADKSSLMVWDDRRERLVLRVSRGFLPESLEQISFTPEEGTVGHVAATGEPVIVEDAQSDPRVTKRAAIIEPEGIRSFMQVPIKVGGEIFGVFSADYVQPRAFGDDETRLFLALAQRAALAIDTAQVYERSQELAVVQERSRLARDLHDAVTQTLFSASLISEALPALWESDQDEGRHLLQELRQLSRGALAEMRTLLLELRPAALVEASIDLLLHQLAEAFTGRTGIPVTVDVESGCVLPSDVHVALYRIAQEALNNAGKHADPTQVEIGLQCRFSAQEADQVAGVELYVSDDGCGFNPGTVPPERLGLSIIRERVQAIGADLEITSRPDCGTRVSVVWEEDGGN
jgi:ligand-binding sensor domain-containing protein/signal transduction histidine kinase